MSPSDPTDSTDDPPDSSDPEQPHPLPEAVRAAFQEAMDEFAELLKDGWVPDDDHARLLKMMQEMVQGDYDPEE